jgi:hypothetical protein
MIAATIVVGDAGMRSPLDDIEKPGRIPRLKRTCPAGGGVDAGGADEPKEYTLFFPPLSNSF